MSKTITVHVLYKSPHYFSVLCKKFILDKIKLERATLAKRAKNHFRRYKVLTI